MIGELLGFNQSIPPFATARGRDILIGVNYASGAAGIRDETGRQLVNFWDLTNLFHHLRLLEAETYWVIESA
uniref:Uncharacterized protein n=1 Tax=Salix viminalis TaxID=40686 RepID=A0A6N2KBC9_SALVM